MNAGFMASLEKMPKKDPIASHSQSRPWQSSRSPPERDRADCRHLKTPKSLWNTIVLRANAENGSGDSRSLLPDCPVHGKGDAEYVRRDQVAKAWDGSNVAIMPRDKL